MILSHLSSGLSNLPDTSAQILSEETNIAQLSVKSTLTIEDLRSLSRVVHMKFVAEDIARYKISLRNLEKAFAKSPHYTLADSGDDFV